MYDKAYDHTNSRVTKTGADCKMLSPRHDATHVHSQLLTTYGLKTPCSTHCIVDIDVIIACNVNILDIGIASQMLTTLQKDGCTAASERHEQTEYACNVCMRI
jgi:hypothetical protein